MQMIAEGHLKPAVEELRKAAVAQPTDGGAARELAHLLHMTGDKGGAVQWLREAVRRNPEDGFAYVDLAVCLMGAGEIADGLSAAEEAVRASPRLHSAQLVLGRARWESGDPAGARAAFDQALLLRPRDVDTLLAAAAVSTELGLEDSALGYARHAVTADPESARAWLVLAGGLAATGRAVEADEALSQARSLDPTAPLFQPSAGANGGGRHAVGHPER
jgi:Flp pilus assembly protein TadD